MSGESKQESGAPSPEVASTRRATKAMGSLLALEMLSLGTGLGMRSPLAGTNDPTWSRRSKEPPPPSTEDQRATKRERKKRLKERQKRKGVKKYR